MRLLKGSFTLYISLSVRVSRIGAKLVCLSITSKQVKVAPECYQVVQRWKQRYPLTDVCIVVYLDDILIYSDDITQHQSHIKEVLKRLRKAGLYVKVKKCEFYLDSVEYLDYVLSPSGLTMSNAKVKTIQEWPEPKKVKDIQSFLGFANFYRHFIFNYSDIVIPLTRLTRKNTPQNFDDNYRIAFISLHIGFQTHNSS